MLAVRKRQLKQDDKLVYALDVWLIYGPEAIWSGDGPHKPRLLMHQLRAFMGSARLPRLDSQAFARGVHWLLAKLLIATPAR
jgi:hypothetical protein